MAPPTGSPAPEADCGGREVVGLDGADVSAFGGEELLARAAVFSVRFSLRCPGRERGRFPSTPPSSAIAGGV
jgi:hypothetical protein